MRIAQVAPLYESVPPQRYGGTERVVSYLTEELVRLGHEVTLFASGDSVTRARLVAPCPHALWQDAECRDTLPHHLRLMERVFRDVSAFDLIHFHTDYVHWPFVRRHPWPSVTTLHGRLHPPDLQGLVMEYVNLPLVSISDSQREPLPTANWRATIYHGLPPELYRYHARPGDYLLFLGRLSPEKRVDRAVTIARCADLPLKVAAKIYPEERAYFQEHVAPLLRSARSFVEFLGEVGGSDKEALLGGARALLFPIDWPEPFGLVMIEAMACGTPVIAWRNGSVPEVITDGVTGYIVDTLDEAVQTVRAVDHLSRHACREVFEARFTAARMARDYLGVYRQVLEDRRWTPAFPMGHAARNGRHPQARPQALAVH